MKNLQGKRKGFTLIELIIVMAIIGILMLLTVPRFLNMTEGARVRTFESNHRSLVSAYATYVADHNGEEPDDIYDLMDDRGNNTNPFSSGTATTGHMIEDLNDNGTVDANNVSVPNPVGATYQIVDENAAGTITPRMATTADGVDTTWTAPAAQHFAILSEFTRDDGSIRQFIFSPVTGTHIGDTR